MKVSLQVERGKVYMEMSSISCCGATDEALQKWHFKHKLYVIFCVFLVVVGVVGWCKSVAYLTSSVHPTEIGLQLGKACYPCSK